MVNKRVDTWEIKYAPDGVTSYTVPLDDDTRDFLKGGIEYVGGEEQIALADILRRLVSVYEAAGLDALLSAKFQLRRPSQKTEGSNEQER